MGIRKHITASDGKSYPNHKYLRKSEKKLAKLQRKLSRKTKDSNNWNKARNKVARLHGKIANQRNDNLHNLTTRLIKAYDVICVETLDIKSMVKTKWLACHIHDVAWGELKRQLRYKSRWYGKQLVEVDSTYPSTNICSGCGHIEPLELSQTRWICATCNAKHDRDLNAAINILNEGLRLIT